MFGRRCRRGSGACVFGWRLSQNGDVENIEGQEIFFEAGAGRTGFCVIEFAVPQIATNWSEADNVVCGGFHINKKFGEDELVA